VSHSCDTNPVPLSHEIYCFRMTLISKYENYIILVTYLQSIMELRAYGALKKRNA